MFLVHTHFHLVTSFLVLDTQLYSMRGKTEVHEKNVFISSGGTMTRRNVFFNHAIWSNTRPLNTRRLFSRRKIVPTMVRLTDDFGRGRDRQARTWSLCSFNLTHAHRQSRFRFWYTSESSRWRVKGTNPPRGRGIYMQVPRRGVRRRVRNLASHKAF